MTCLLISGPVFKSYLSSLLVTASIPKVKETFFTLVKLFYMPLITPVKGAYFWKIYHCTSFRRSKLGGTCVGPTSHNYLVVVSS
jgi:hypothetical protein